MRVFLFIYVIKLSIILREVLEGAKVTFDDNGKATSIDISYRHLDGEQMQTDDSVNKRHGYQVYYSLSSDSKAQNIKASQDALKYNSDLINPNQLKDLLKHTILTHIPKVDYIGYLESKGGLNQLLLKSLQELYGNAEAISIEKVQYDQIDNAVDWDSFSKQTEPIKKSIIDFLYKTAEKKPPYTIRKSDQIQSVVVKQLHSKYDIGLHPSGENKKYPPIFMAIIDCLTKGKTMLIIDDNTHTGTDFVKLFEGVEKIKEHILTINSKRTPEEEQGIVELDNIKKHRNFKTSPHLQQKANELERQESLYRERVGFLNKAIYESRQHFFGYVLYLLKDSDLKK